MSPHAVDTKPLDCLSDAVLRKRFDVGINGFAPAEVPLQRLPGDYYEPWERLVHGLPALLKSDRLRHEVQRLDVLSTDRLETEAEWRRAYSMLAFLAQGYIWGGDTPAQILPSAISVPFLAVSKRLDMPPVLTYAASNLWNFTSDRDDFSHLDSLHTAQTFTGTEDESWFFMVSVAMEVKAGYAIPAMMRALDAIKVQDYETVTQSLEALEDSIVEVGRLLERMYEKCDSSVFFHQIRPFLAGSKNMADAGLPNGVFYDEGDGKGEWMQLRGGSNGQSSLIQFWDVMLGVQHRNEGNSTPHANSVQQPKPLSFHEEVHAYMPGPHRRLLQYVKGNSTIRQVAFACHGSTAPEQQRLWHQYDSTVQTLVEFRNKHIRLVTRYIIVPSKQAAEVKRQNLAAASRNGKDDELTGTGGTALLPFLKQSRDETRQTTDILDS